MSDQSDHDQTRTLSRVDLPRVVVPFAAPWNHDREEFADWGWVRDSNGHLVAKCVLPIGTDENQHRRDGPDPTESVARLIAAAPDLLAACQEALRRTPSYSKTIGPMLDAAITKALGDDWHNAEVSHAARGKRNENTESDAGGVGLH